MGKKTPNTIRSRHVSFRLSTEEHFRLVDKAHRSGLSVGEFLRARAIGARKRKAVIVEGAASLPDEIKLVTQLRKIGVNVNQIAHHCNRYQVPPPADLGPLLSEIRSLLSASFAPSRR